MCTIAINPINNFERKTNGRIQMRGPVRTLKSLRSIQAKISRDGHSLCAQSRDRFPGFVQKSDTVQIFTNHSERISLTSTL